MKSDCFRVSTSFHCFIFLVSFFARKQCHAIEKSFRIDSNSMEKEIYIFFLDKSLASIQLTFDEIDDASYIDYLLMSFLYAIQLQTK